MSLLVVALAGGAVAMAGSIGFVGLIVPHMARKLLPADHRWLLPGCALLGACLLLLADILARVVIVPQEVPVGVMTALFGAPFFIFCCGAEVVMDKRGAWIMCWCGGRAFFPPDQPDHRRPGVAGAVAGAGGDGGVAWRRQTDVVAVGGGAGVVVVAA